MKALNFYSADYHGHLLCRKKTCTIRLGDKTAKYAEGDIIWITAGQRFTPRKKIFTAVIDRVYVKQLNHLTPEDLKGESPDITDLSALMNYLVEIYDKPIEENHLVTVIYFSEIIE